MRIPIPLWLRNPRAHARIKRRLLPTGVEVIEFDRPLTAAELGRIRDGFGKQYSETDRHPFEDLPCGYPGFRPMTQAEINALVRGPYRRSDFFADGGVYLPADAPRWRWWRDPLVIGGAVGAVVVLAFFLIWGGL